MCDVAEKYDVIEGDFLRVIQGLEEEKKACTASGAADGCFLPRVIRITSRLFSPSLSIHTHPLVGSA